MIPYRRVLKIALTSAFAVPLLSHAAIPSQYRITDVGSLGGSTTYAAALNDASPVQVTGTSWLSGDTGYRAFIYTVGGLMTAINYGADEGTWGRGINDDGYVSADNSLVGFVYHDGVTTTLPTPTPSFDSWVGMGGISNSGFVAGTVNSVTGGTRAIRYSLVDNSLLELGTAGGLSDNSYGVAVNVTGQLAGNVQDTAGEYQHAMFFDGTTLHDLGALNSWGSAYGLNDAGQVVGEVMPDIDGPNWDSRAFLRDTAGTTTLLANLPGSGYSVANAINNLSQIVGFGVTHTGIRAVLWSDNQLVNLNHRLEPSSLSPYVVLEAAVDINDSGWILVNGYDTRVGTNHAYLLEPVWP